ncbi:OmpA family protein [Acinetobacter schindleri]|uniref:OmpA family protein n=1 Tax=Acinetobacter schindleri TaxID=108981 RepID=UPI0040457D73
MPKSLPTLLIISSFGLTACVSNHYTHPSDLRFQDNKSENNQKIRVKRDEVLCAEDTKGIQKCPIEFYIDSIKAGDFYIKNSINYNLKSDVYNFKVKNCTENSCQSCDVDLAIGSLENNQFVLSVDNTGKPFISNNGSPLACKMSAKDSKTSNQSTLILDLAADTLFKFNGSSLNDLLPRGRQEVLNVASQISNNFISVSNIKLTGHTDRLGSDSYNQQLGQSRADTVRHLLVQNGISGNSISTTSAGKNQPVTNGCFDVKQREELKTCLQPDRRVSVEITGFIK